MSIVEIIKWMQQMVQGQQNHSSSLSFLEHLGQGVDLSMRSCLSPFTKNYLW